MFGGQRIQDHTNLLPIDEFAGRICPRTSRQCLADLQRPISFLPGLQLNADESRSPHRRDPVLNNVASSVSRLFLLDTIETCWSGKKVILPEIWKCTQHNLSIPFDPGVRLNRFVATALFYAEAHTTATGSATKHGLDGECLRKTRAAREFACDGRYGPGHSHR
jgi:hypothetical protein